jgi:ligand-binding sensor domain-containing protein/serine phosphatase RsbU (regulator of sigma subunit)
VVWIGRQGYGLAKISPATFVMYRDPDDPDPASGTDTPWDVWDLYQAKDQVLWVALGKQNGGLDRLERKTGRVKRLRADPEDPTALASSEITRVIGDGGKSVWVGSLGGGLHRVDAASARVVRHFRHDPADPTTISSDDITDLEMGAAGSLLIGTLGGGLASLDPRTERLTRYTFPNPKMNAVFAIVSDRREPAVLWLGTSAGIARFDTRTTDLKLFETHAGEASQASKADEEISSIFQDDRARLWVGTMSAGLKMLDLDAKAFRTFGRAEGLPSNSVNCVLVDPTGQVWAATPSGLSRLNVGTGAVTNFDASDGLPSLEWTDGGCQIDASSGELFFAAGSGFVVIDPKKVEVEERIPPVALTEVRLGDERLPVASSMSFGYRDVFTIDFAVLSFAGPTSAAYQLEGRDTEWIPLGSQRSVTFSHLPPGDYKVRIRGANRHGKWNEAGATLALSIAPPVWRTYPAYGIYAALLALGGLGLVQLQRRKMARLQEQIHLKAIENDVALTAEAQSWFLPKASFLQARHVSVCGIYRPAGKCGGDWWWYEDIDDRRMLVLVGDVTGHGGGPAILTASIATALRASGEGERAADVGWRLARLHKEIWTVTEGYYQMTVTAILLDKLTGQVRVFSGGGLPVVTINDRKPRVHPGRGTPLGGSDLAIGESTLTLTAGTRLLLFTDGLPERPLPDGRDLGLRRFLQLVAEHLVDQPLDAGLAAALAASDVRCGSEQPDDITMVALEWHGPGQPARPSLPPTAARQRA